MIIYKNVKLIDILKGIPTNTPVMLSYHDGYGQIDAYFLKPDLDKSQYSNSKTEFGKTEIFSPPRVYNIIQIKIKKDKTADNPELVKSINIAPYHNINVIIGEDATKVLDLYLTPKRERPHHGTYTDISYE